jgi:hypothetical protein
MAKERLNFIKAIFPTKNMMCLRKRLFPINSPSEGLDDKELISDLDLARVRMP